MPFPVSGPREQAALRDLADRLRKILGSFQAAGFAGPGTSNITTLYPEMDVDNLDGIVYQSADSLTVLVTTRALLGAWLRSPVAPADSGLPRDPITALASHQVYELAFPQDAMVLRYADIPVDSAAQLGLVTAMLVARAQDYGALTPEDVTGRLYCPASAIAVTQSPAKISESEISTSNGSVGTRQRSTSRTM